MAKLGVAKPSWGRTYAQEITASTTLSASDSGKVLMVATDALVITLPACAAGLQFTFVNTGADGNNIITLSPQSTDSIWGTITLAGSVVDLGGVANKDLINTKTSAIKGDTATIVSDGTDWYVTSSTGIWAAEA
tara:strand:- start:47 stop:448 length:402 start_codon:yes stop_codon:yes gene_type:complete